MEGQEVTLLPKQLNMQQQQQQHKDKEELGQLEEQEPLEEDQELEEQDQEGQEVTLLLKLPNMVLVGLDLFQAAEVQRSLEGFHISQVTDPWLISEEEDIQWEQDKCSLVLVPMEESSHPNMVFQEVVEEQDFLLEEIFINEDLVLEEDTRLPQKLLNMEVLEPQVCQQEDLEALEWLQGVSALKVIPVG